MRSATLRDRLWAKVKKTDGCWMWTGALRNGYGIINRCDKVPEYAHRLAYEFENGPIADGLCVLHTCDNRACVNPSHLWLGTKRDNTHDMMRKGRQRFSNWRKELQ